MSEELKNEVNTAEEQVKLDSPLVVHKKSDASYQETASEVSMNETHIEEEVTLERHRFRKKPKKKGKGVALLVIVVIIAAVFTALYYTGNISFGEKDTTTTKKTTTTESTTLDIKEQYKGTIVVKNTYIFVNGEEVNGISGLQKALKYEDPDPTAYTIIDEGANSDFLNFEILSILESMGFYDERTDIKHIDSTGLIADAETTTVPPSTTTTTKKPKPTKEKENKE